MAQTAARVRRFEAADLEWAESVVDREFGGRWQTRRGELVDVLALPGLVAESNTQPAGLLTFRRDDLECELAFLWAREQHRGVGTILLGALREAVADCRRVWVVTTNDNLEALRFYQRRGFVLCALRAGAIDAARQRFKPSISSIGNVGIPLRDELELELILSFGS